jgi:WD40 repeat protein
LRYEYDTRQFYFYHYYYLEEESCNFIAVYIHPHQSVTSRQTQADKDYVFLVGASSDGQIYIFNRFGTISERYQIHSGQITAIAVSSSQQCICTAASDNTIKIVSVNPYSRKILTVAMTIPISFVSRHICLSDNAILAATEEGVVSMYSFNLEKAEFKIMTSHPRADDHTEPIRDISSLAELDLFYTVSSDKTLKIWDIWNTLIREIQFDDPVPSVCCLNSKGDILVALKNRLDVIPGQTCILFMH